MSIRKLLLATSFLVAIGSPAVATSQLDLVNTWQYFSDQCHKTLSGEFCNQAAITYYKLENAGCVRSEGNSHKYDAYWACHDVSDKDAPNYAVTPEGKAIQAKQIAEQETDFAAASEQQAPQFSDFPATQYSHMASGKIDLTGDNAKQFRTRLTEGAHQLANFAGHYVVVVWGCGTSCRGGAVIDSFTGRVVFIPDTFEDGQVEFAYRYDSKLMIFTSTTNFDDNQSLAKPIYKVFRGKTFTNTN